MTIIIARRVIPARTVLVHNKVGGEVFDKEHGVESKGLKNDFEA